MFKDIKGIKYEQNDRGRAFGGGIYGASCTVGFSNAPTKITLNIVSNNGEYDISEIDLDVTAAGEKELEIGNVKFRRMYLYSYSFNNSSGSKTLTVNFVDQSLCLDKIFVGLTGRHGTMTEHDAEFYNWNAYNPSNTIQVTAFSETFAFRILCLECNSLTPTKTIEPAPNEPPYDITRMLYMAGDGNVCPFPLGTYIQVFQGQPSIDGGYILLGKETFADTNCEIPKVDYAFDDLCNALDYILGADPHGCNGTPSFAHNLRNFNRSSTYRASYTGTLREVLSSWAADFSFDFTFDYTKEDIWVEGMDLQNAIDLSPIRTAIDQGFGPDSIKDKDDNDQEGALVRSHTEKHSLENTYKQSPLVKYIKPPRQFQRTKKHYEPAVGKVITPAEALGNTAHLGRTDDELYVSMALAKYSPEARIIWLSDVARRKWEQDAMVTNDWDNAGGVIPNFLPPPAGGGPANLSIGARYGHGYPKLIDGKMQPAWVNPLPYNNQQDANGDVIPNNGAPQEWCPEYLQCPEATPNLAIQNKCVHCSNFSKEVGWQNPRRRLDVPWVALGFFPIIEVGDHPTDNDAYEFKQALLGPLPHPTKISNPIARKTTLLGMFGGAKIGNQTSAMNHPIWNNPDNYSVYIGIWNKTFQSKVEEFDKKLADDFLGKYGYWYGDRLVDNEELSNFGPVNPPVDERQCPKFHLDLEGNQDHALYMYQHRITTIPESKIYSGGSYPFQSILKANGGHFAVPEEVRPPNGPGDTDPCTYCPERSIFKIEDNTWGTAQENVDDMLKNHFIVNTELTNDFVNNLVPQSDIFNYVPIYAFLNENREIDSYLIQIAKIPNYRDSIAKPDHMQSGYFPGIAIIPRMEKALVGAPPKKILNIETGWWASPPDGNCTTSACEYKNEMVYHNARRRLLESIKAPPNDCILYCEEDIVNTICKCPDIDEPIHGFTNYSGRYLRMHHLHESILLVYPIEHDYTGFWVSEIAHKGTYPRKQIVMGQPPLPTELRNAGGGRGVMATRIVDVDVTQDLDALEVSSQGQFEEKLVVTNPFTDTNEVVTLPDYYAFLQSITESADTPLESISVRLDGTGFDTLSDNDGKNDNINLLSPAFGLNSFTITLGADGIATDLAYASRPHKLPKRDVLLQKIGPRALEGRIPRQPVNIREGDWGPGYA